MANHPIIYAQASRLASSQGEDVPCFASIEVTPSLADRLTDALRVLRDNGFDSISIRPPEVLWSRVHAEDPCMDFAGCSQATALVLINADGYCRVQGEYLNSAFHTEEFSVREVQQIAEAQAKGTQVPSCTFIPQAAEQTIRCALMIETMRDTAAQLGVDRQALASLADTLASFSLKVEEPDEEIFGNRLLAEVMGYRFEELPSAKGRRFVGINTVAFDFPHSTAQLPSMAEAAVQACQPCRDALQQFLQIENLSGPMLALGAAMYREKVLTMPEETYPRERA